MKTFYVDPSDVPSGTKLPSGIRCSPERLPERAQEIAGRLDGEGQIGLYRDSAYGEFVGYAIKEGGLTRFEPAEAETN